MEEVFYYIYKQSILQSSVIVLIAVVDFALLNACFFYKKKQLQTLMNLLILIGTLISIILFTLTRKERVSQINLTPFYVFFRLKKGDDVEFFRSFFMNVLLFVPLGLSMPYVLSRKLRKWPVFVTIGFGTVLSASIEFLQYYYHLGRCETDDVIANALGTAVGTLSYLLYIRILKNREESLMNGKISDNQKLLLNLCAKSLFNKEFDLPSEFVAQKLLEEAKRQTVFSQVFSFVKDKCDKNADILFSQIIAKNIRVEFGHNEVHKALSDNNIPYVVLKGVASASYYKEPMLRMMGDIDILVSPENISRADAALKSIGFVTDEQIDVAYKHIAYKRRDGLVCELHREINGIPQNDAGEKIREYFADVFDSSIECKTSNGSCVVPGKFHHGLILLLHTANHLTNEGVGLRHLCDWAVFVNGLSNDEFVQLFEKPLKKMGLWRFATLLTVCSIKYLECGDKAWVGEVDAALLDGMIADILNGGNFGYKDKERYSQIKYISDRQSGETAKKSPVLQLFSSINQKTKKEFKFVNKSKFLLPIGWIFTVCKYLYLVIMGKRTLDGASTIMAAKQRKAIYDEFKLFDNDNL